MVWGRAALVSLPAEEGAWLGSRQLWDRASRVQPGKPSHPVALGVQVSAPAALWPHLAGSQPSRLNPALALLFSGATKDMGKMLGGDEEMDPDAAKKEEERQEALRQAEEERKAKYAKMEAEREAMRQGIRDKVGTQSRTGRSGSARVVWLL